MGWWGEPWPSEHLRAPVCEDDSERVPVPVGLPCLACRELIREGERGTVTSALVDGEGGWPEATAAPIHVECSLRTVIGGAGHHADHARWCVEARDPDAGLTYRRSALLVTQWCGLFLGVEGLLTASEDPQGRAAMSADIEAART